MRLLANASWPRLWLSTYTLYICYIIYSYTGHHVWKSQASDESLAKNDDLEPRERFVLWGKNIRQGAPL